MLKDNGPSEATEAVKTVVARKKTGQRQPPAACGTGFVTSAKSTLLAGSHCYLSILVSCMEVTCAGTLPSPLELDGVSLSHSCRNLNATSLDDTVERAVGLRHATVGGNIPISSPTRGTHTPHAGTTLPKISHTPS